MADTKISALTALVAGDIQHTSDVVAIVDTSVTTTKKATAQAVVNAVLAQNTDTTVTGTINQTTIPTSKTLLVSTDIGSTVQGYDAQLADVAGLAVTDGNFIVGNGSNFVAESGSTARTSLGLGTGDSPEFTAVNIGSATDTTVTRVSAGVIAVEGSNVLLASNIGTSVQAYDAQLADVAGLAVTDGNFIVGNGANFVAESGATARTSLGLGTGDSPEFTAVNIGSATDTTITRSSAGVIAVEGSNVLMASNIGSTVQAYDAQLADVAGLTPTDNGVIIGNGANFVVESGATLKTSLGLTIGTDVQAYDADTAKTDVAQTFTAAQTFGADVTLNAQSDLRFADSDSSNWVAFQAPATVASNVTWTLPAADGTSNQVLATNGSGTLSWATAGGGASISAGDSKVEVTDTGSDGTIVFNTDNAERMRVDSSGNVGIGTTSPSVKFQVEGTIPEINFISYSGSNNYGVTHRYRMAKGTLASPTIVGSGQEIYTLVAQGYDGSAFRTAASIRMNIDATSAANDMPGRIAFFTTPDGSTTDTERARITSGGYFKASNSGTYSGSTGSYHEFYQSSTDDVALLVRSANASQNQNVLQVTADRNTTDNTFFAINYFNVGAAAYKFRVADSGNVTNTNNSYGSISDVKLKQDIVDAGSQWDDIKNLRVRKYRWKSDPDGFMQMGLVAQEAEEVSPGLIDEHPDYEEIEVTDEEGNVTKQRNALGTTTKAVKYSVLYMKAVKALQEAQLRIETLEAQNAAFETRLAALEAN